MKKKSTILIAAIFLLGLLACQFTPATFLPSGSEPTVQVIQPIPTKYSPAVVVSGEDIITTDLILTNLYEAANPGVVSIVTQSDQGSASGSGFVYDKNGHIITNYHVVEGAKTLEVDFPSGVKVEASVIATDLDSDIAVIKVNLDPTYLVPLPLGDSDLLKVGQMVVAIGNPFRLTSTITLGIVSAKGRILDSIRTSQDSTPFSAGDIIQTDASINPGNSGGPLLNLSGEVVGVNRAIRTTGYTSSGDPVNSGIGYAISINIVKRVVPFLIRDGFYDYPYLGISSSTFDLTLAEWQALGTNQTTGAYITSITAGGPADQAGLLEGTERTSIIGLLGGGDIIIAVDGRPVNVYGDLISYITVNKFPGEQIVLTIIRDNVQKEVTLTLGKRP